MDSGVFSLYSNFVSCPEKYVTVCIILMYVAILFWCVPWMMTSSIPVVLLIALFLLEKEALFAELRSYRTEIVLVLLILCLGVVFSWLPEKSVKGGYDFARGIVFFFPACILVRRYPEKVKSLFWPLLITAIIFFLAAAIWVYTQNFAVPRGFLKGLISCFRHYNAFGTCTALLAGLSLVGLLFHDGALAVRRLAWALPVAGMALTVVSGSRGSVVALLVAIAVTVGCRLKRGRLAWFLGGSTLLAFFLYLLQSGILGRLLPGWYRGGDFTSGRVLIFRSILDAVWEQGRWFGFGINSYRYLDVAQPLRYRLMLPHNVFLEAWFSLGIVGCLLAALLVARLLFRLHRRPVHGMLYYSGLAIVVFYLMRGLVDMKLFSQYYPAALAFGFGLMQGAGSPSSGRLEQ
ncbi:O-antigen ligase [Geothermobacter ehrlichii]|uniref:O-antigen ligase n=1 Tax=Geothermobacter ehrlichii TaxID=213224 RepID=A0A5D3WPB9_9BACT|nr:O-antigen ligase family protein [Geothermobacter ehrlichii]TYP00057.1 O-antigen ligase [Geothermobacter ehrlichii]